MKTARWRRTFLVLGLFLVLPTRAVRASPSFDLHISSGGVEDLAVGQRLTLVALQPPPTCLPPPYTGARKRPAPPARMPVVWSVEPAELATIDAAGTLRALKPGHVIVHVACRDEKAEECRLTSPGKKRFNLYEDLTDGQLPRLDGGPRIESFLVRWDATPFQNRHEIIVSMQGAAFAWSAGLATATMPESAFPWVFEIAPDRRWFDDDDGYDQLSEERHRAYVTSARFTITGWKDGILSGRLQFQAVRGFACDAAFRARLEDRDGVLARAERPDGGK